ncbi:MAG: YhgN family NAAT transporter [Rhabdochlamydiaceae bacterium]|nr:YhgN family NAAT transporter [Rhabdochlamydiaceae bacterium]
MDTLLQILSVAFALFLLMDPLGNVPIFVAVLKDVDPKRQRVIIFRELIIALAIIICFNFLGNFLLDLLKVQQSTLLVSGGIILFIIAIRMIFPSHKDPELDLSREKEPFIVPLAVPMVAGPAVLAAVMLYSYQDHSEWITVAAIVIAWAISTLILLASPTLKKLLGDKGLIASERLMGLILVLISVQMFLEGVRLFILQSQTIHA